MISPLTRLQGTLVATLFCLSVSAASAQTLSVRERHDQLVSMAHDIVRHRPEFLKDAGKAKFFVCNEGHLHWCIGWPGLESEIFPMQERLRIELFWKALTPGQRIFWKPYLKQVDALTVQYLELISQRQLNMGDEQAFADAAERVYENGVAEYARRHGVVPQEECDPICCAAAYAEIAIVSNVENVASIQWVEAGEVWISIANTGREPEYRTIVPGTITPVAPGGAYYYKLVLDDGRESQRLLAPAITDATAQLVLTWR